MTFFSGDECGKFDNNSLLDIMHKIVFRIFNPFILASEKLVALILIVFLVLVVAGSILFERDESGASFIYI